MRHGATWRLAQQALENKNPAALVTVAAVKGSAPREAGACMCVTSDAIAGTIGGGTLEYQAIDSAREMLLGNSIWLHQQLGLGPALGQCCGGRVELLLERLDPSDLHWLSRTSNASPNSHLLSKLHSGGRSKVLQTGASDGVDFETLHTRELQLSQPLQPGHFHLLMFGAGHLGKALAPLLATLPCTVHWVDTREKTLPRATAEHVRTEWLEAPTMALQDTPSGSLVLVMTHNHALDFDIAAAALANENIAWVGMIGSHSKRRQFERYLLKHSSAVSSGRLACPIGTSSVDLREPNELAIILAGALLQARGQRHNITSENQHHA